jgi:hypothetical protein
LGFINQYRWNEMHFNIQITRPVSGLLRPLDKVRIKTITMGYLLRHHSIVRSK